MPTSHASTPPSPVANGAHDANGATRAVCVREVGLRDGLQAIARVLPTELKCQWIQRAHAAGVREIEVGSFVPARLLPQLADTAELVAFAKTLPGLRASVLVPNVKGAQRAIEVGAHAMLVPLSASHAHSLANLRKTPDAVLDEIRSMRQMIDSAARAAGQAPIHLEVGLSTAFGCTIQGDVPEAEVLRLVQALLDLGVDSIGLADTVGYANPVQVRRLFERARALAGERLNCGHFHDTRGLALANVFTAWQCGITRFDASLAGIGGCPHAPGASGNVATEDLAFMLDAMDLQTGLDIPALLALRADVARWLEGETLHGTLWRAGLPKTHPQHGESQSARTQAGAQGTNAVPAAAPIAPPTTARTTAPSTAPATARALPLAGVRVVEFTHMVMGPTCGMVLADLGAEVIKVEPIDGDRTRHLLGAGAGFFPMFNRNKQSILIDLHKPDGAATARRLAASADVVVENFKPGTMVKYGLDYSSLSAVNPRLIYASLKGFLPGPYEHRTALDEVVQMMGGLAYMTGRPGDPLRAGSSVNDIMGGMFGAIAIQGALIERARSGRGQEIQSALFENNVFLVGQHMMQFAVTGEPAAPMPDRISSWAIYDVFTVKNDEQIFLAAVSDAQWKTFCEALGFADLLANTAYASNNDRVKQRPTLMPVVRERLARWTAAELSNIFEAHGLPFAPISKPEELLNDAHLLATGGLVDVRLTDGPRAGSLAKTTLLPVTLDGRRLGVRSNPPQKGEQTMQILRSLGADSDQIAAWKAAGAVA